MRMVFEPSRGALIRILVNISVRNSHNWPTWSLVTGQSHSFLIEMQFMSLMSFKTVH